MKYFVIFLSIVSILILYSLSTLSQPIRIDINKIEKYEGQTVIVRGTIKEYQNTQYGGQIINIIDTQNSSELIVYIDTITEIQYGDVIEATGKVQKYNNEWEVVVSDYRLLKIISEYNETKTPIWQLAVSPEKFCGLNINVTGYIDRDYESYFYLVDGSEKYSIAVYYDNSKSYNFTSGDTIFVEGRFFYEEEFLRYSINSVGEKYRISRV